MFYANITSRQLYEYLNSTQKYLVFIDTLINLSSLCKIKMFLMLQALDRLVQV
jgi:hypothetical protein